MTSALGRSIERVLANLDINQYVPLTEDVPIEPSSLYSSFGYPRHPLTREPVKNFDFSGMEPQELDIKTLRNREKTRKYDVIHRLEKNAKRRVIYLCS